MADGKYRILCLDGGGIRGLLTAYILEKINASFSGFLDSIDLIAGTSTGGIIAIGLAAGIAPEKLRKFYENNGKRIFADTRWDNIKDLGKLRGAQYGNINLRELIANILDDADLEGTQLKHLKHKVLISSFDTNNQPIRLEMMRKGIRPLPKAYQIQSWKPKFFNNFADNDNPDLEEEILDVAMRTSAAPTYFPAYGRYIDGGVIANNPSMCAVAQALDSRGAARSINEIVLLSLGTGNLPLYIDGDDHDWGAYQWMMHQGRQWIIDILMNGAAGLADFQCEQILGRRYHRCNPILATDVRLDGWQETELLKETVDGDHECMDSLFKWIQSQW